MIIENGTLYENNFARAAAYHLGTCAQPPENEKYINAYKFITDIYNKIMLDAESIGFSPVDDVYFTPWEKQKGREKDVKAIRGAIEKIDKIIKSLFDMVNLGTAEGDSVILPSDFPKPSKQLVNALNAVGASFVKGEQLKLELPAGCIEGLNELCRVSNENVIKITDSPIEDKTYLFFSRCVFDSSANWTAKNLDRYLKADGAFLSLCDGLEKLGYSRIACREGKKISLDYIKQRGKKTEPIKKAWGERTHSGFEVTYEDLINEPCYLWLRMPMYKTVLENIETFSDETAEFLCNITKSCNGCRYCVQTDKTGKRPLAAIKIGKEKKCPLMPAFSMNWRHLTPELSNSIVKLMGELDKLSVLDE